ncbi:sigma-70 family RNA polymerase sigma factor [Mycolicibacterium tusciae]|uniref:sigma-70 family RNA polymerase sigma factor n=1 Tax=Mycolicibacterium tusciae TaxID=75922 RepID=UPI00024A15FE|nr:sigma-70 family RNA polymerase sigma factor [Mycolicibacterium tusciae]
MSIEALKSRETLEEAAVTFLACRDRLFGIAFRILNDCAAAEDIVQDAWLRWQTCDRSVVLDPLAFLTTTTKRLCINVVQSARARHETHMDSWLPEPVDRNADPERRIEQCEALELAALTLLERLSPPERAAYVLREAFDYSYAEIATIVEVTQANARQLVSRARKRLAAERREAPTGAEQKRLVVALTAAAQSGDLSTLETVFTEDLAVAA